MTDTVHIKIDNFTLTARVKWGLFRRDEQYGGQIYIDSVFSIEADWEDMENFMDYVEDYGAGSVKMEIDDKIMDELYDLLSENPFRVCGEKN